LLQRVRERWTAQSGEQPPFRLDNLLAPTPWTKALMDEFAPQLERAGLSWDRLPALVQARHEVFELDAKFGGLGEGGVFDALDHASVLQHRVADLDVADAVLNPPSDTRARIRGEVVRRLSAAGARYAVEWTRVHDEDGQRDLDLGNPFETEERWHPVSSPIEP
jgi:proteasome accessory factor A